MNKNLKRDKKKKGFTLIELIIVIAILTILAAVAIPNLTSVRDNAKVKADAASVEVIRRSTVTLLADDEIVAADKTATITFGTDSKPTVAYSTTGTDKTSQWTTSEQTSFNSSIKDVKQPQVKGKNEFIVTITSAGDVTVTTGPVTNNQ